MHVLVWGSGAREHALAWHLSRDERVDRVTCAPGNGGTGAWNLGKPVHVGDPQEVTRVAQGVGADFVVIGPEVPLVAGAVDALEQAGIPAFGPGKKAAQLEGSKVFSKAFMARHGIPTAGFAVFEASEVDQAERYIREGGRPLVVKADGLAAGKGVIVAATVDETVAAVRGMLVDGNFGAAGTRVLLEERLEGQEVSYHVVCDGEHYVPLAAAQDHKRAFDGDAGPNTGGMGAYSPPPVVDAALESRILQEVVEPTLAGMRADGCPFKGVLFIGLMVQNGVPKVLEYNVRFGDPECQTLLARWDGDLLGLLLGAARGQLEGVQARWKAPASMCVVLAAEGYPGAYRKGEVIVGLPSDRLPSDRLAADGAPVDNSLGEGVRVFHAGTDLADGQVVTSGGRVLSVVAHGADIGQARERAYGALGKVSFEGAHYRSDIGFHAFAP